MLFVIDVQLSIWNISSMRCREFLKNKKGSRSPFGRVQSLRLSIKKSHALNRGIPDIYLTSCLKPYLQASYRLSGSTQKQRC